MRLAAASYTITFIVLCFAAEAARGGGADGGATHHASVGAMIDCRLWLSAIDDCPTAAFAGTPGAAPAPPAHNAADGPDREGIKRDTYYFIGLQLSIVGALYFMPESVSGWSEQQKNQHHADKWWNNVSGPTWDDDEHYINYVLHPYWGAAYYVRARERGYGRQDAFLYSLLLSTLYETGVEALFEPVSIQDFFVTPIVGSWVGGHFMQWRRAARDRMAGEGEPRLRDKVLLVVTDPLGNAADFIDRRLGRDVEFTAAPFIMHGAPAPEQRSGLRPDDRPSEIYGLKLMLRW